MRSKSSALLTSALLGYCCWNASNLFSISGIRFESLGWVTLLIWAIPIIYYLFIYPNRFGGNPYFLGAALVISFLSSIVDLNVLAHLGFGISLASLIPPALYLAPWYLSGLAWFPAFSYFGARYFPDDVLLLRILITVLGAGWAVWSLHRRKS